MSVWHKTTRVESTMQVAGFSRPKAFPLTEEITSALGVSH